MVSVGILKVSGALGLFFLVSVFFFQNSQIQAIQLLHRECLLQCTDCIFSLFWFKGSVYYHLPHNASKRSPWVLGNVLVMC